MGLARDIAPPATGSLSRRLIWVYPPLLVLEELLISNGYPQMGLLLLGLLLLLLAVHMTFAVDRAVQRLVLAMTLVPSIRIVSITLPLVQLPQVSWYPLIAMVLLFYAWIIVNTLRLAPGDLGLRSGSLLFQLMLGLGGIGIGTLAAWMIAPAPLLGSVDSPALWVVVACMLLLVGFDEEFIFRGILQSTALPVLGRFAIPFVALLFAVLHAGFHLVGYILLVLLTALLFGYIVRWSGSILGVALARGLINIILLLGIPFIAPDSAIALGNGSILPATVAFALTSALPALFALGWLVRRRLKARKGQP